MKFNLLSIEKTLYIYYPESGVLTEAISFVTGNTYTTTTGTEHVLDPKEEVKDWEHDLTQENLELMIARVDALYATLEFMGGTSLQY